MIFFVRREKPLDEDEAQYLEDLERRGEMAAGVVRMDNAPPPEGVKSPALWKLSKMFEAASRADTIHFAGNWQTKAARILMRACEAFDAFLIIDKEWWKKPARQRSEENGEPISENG